MTYLRIELLDILTGPDVGSLDGQENVPLIRRDFNHHDIVDDRAHQSPHDLRRERRSWRYLCILPKLQILHHTNTLKNRIVPEQREIHVCQRLTRMKISPYHLHNWL